MKTSDSYPQTNAAMIEVLMDDALVKKSLIAKDESVFEEIFNLFSGACIALSWKVLRNEAKAQDVVQSVFVDLYTNPDKFDPSRGSIRTYLLTKSRSKSIDLLRSEKARFMREDKVGMISLHEMEVSNLSVEEEIEKLSLSASMESALRKLSEDEKQAIIYSYYKGYTYREVAVMLDQPEGTVKSRIRSAMTKLKTHMEDFVYSESAK